jgi:hypothetical protein
MHGNQIPLPHSPPYRPEGANTTVETDTNLASAVRNEHILQPAMSSDPLSNYTGVVPGRPTSLVDKDPEELLMLLAIGDPGIIAFIHTKEGIEWLLSSTYLPCPMRREIFLSY